jgi:hypothetical protein
MHWFNGIQYEYACIIRYEWVWTVILFYVTMSIEHIFVWVVMLLKTVNYSKITEFFHLITLLYCMLSCLVHRRDWFVYSWYWFYILKEISNIKENSVVSHSVSTLMEGASNVWIA